jgi:holliday junction DNA helicase RuvA
MIGSLRGTLLERTAAEAIVDVAGVGYRVLVAPATLATLGEPGATVTVHTHLHVREDALTLYGFATRDERTCFEALLGAHGVGPAMALAILSVHRPAALRAVLAGDDVDALCLVPGVGRKTAARLLLELKSRLDLPDGDLDAVIGANEARGVLGEVREALVSLGYGNDEIRSALRDLSGEGDTSRLLKEALTRLSTVR